MIFDRYDNWGNPTCTHVPHGNYQAVIYGYDHSLPIAQVKNAQGGGPEDYITSQTYTFSGNASGIVNTFTSNMDQTLRLEIDMSADSLITVESDCTMSLVVHNATTRPNSHLLSAVTIVFGKRKRFQSAFRRSHYLRQLYPDAECPNAADRLALDRPLRAFHAA
ncbi:MAG: hypothetical protein ACLR8Y_09825 [Alistipes indistinctus]